MMSAVCPSVRPPETLYRPIVAFMVSVESRSNDHIIAWQANEKCFKCLNIASEGAQVTCGGRLFQKLAPETGKARLPKVERLNGVTASWLQEIDRSLCRVGTSHDSDTSKIWRHPSVTVDMQLSYKCYKLVVWFCSHTVVTVHRTQYDRPS